MPREFEKWSRSKKKKNSEIYIKSIKWNINEFWKSEIWKKKNLIMIFHIEISNIYTTNLKINN